MSIRGKNDDRRASEAAFLLKCKDHFDFSVKPVKVVIGPDAVGVSVRMSDCREEEHV
jgi:hypothetical protein